jgi:hypothetical protein
VARVGQTPRSGDKVKEIVIDVGSGVFLNLLTQIA